MKAGFVGIFGKPNAGKSTLLNALMGETLAAVSHKVQTTRHRIKGILNGKDSQIVFSDTPGIIEPKYRLHERMMMAVKSALEDADLALLILDIRDDWGQNDELFKALDLRVPALVVLNKTDKVESEKLDGAKEFFKSQPYCRGLIEISALKGKNLDRLVELILGFLPEGVPFYDGEEISDLSTRFFVSEIIRARIYDFYAEEIPYHSTVLIREFKEKESLTKIAADIVVQRETQKGIILGEGGRSIKKLGTESRKEIEKFLGVKVFLELFVKLRPHWREDDLYLKEYGY